MPKVNRRKHAAFRVRTCSLVLPGEDARGGPTSGMSKRAGGRCGDGRWLRRDAAAARSPVAAGSAGCSANGAVLRAASPAGPAGDSAPVRGSRRSATAWAPSEGYAGGHRPRRNWLLAHGSS